MKIAVIGSGISGLSAAWLLSGNHHVTLFEAEAQPGGHTHTVDITVDDFTQAIDTGFLVFNDQTYPNLTSLFQTLGVRWSESEMSFSVQIERDNLEWSGIDLLSVFAQRRNVINPRFLRMLRDILRFNRETTRLMRESRHLSGTVGEFLSGHSYSQEFFNWYLLPMAAAIWHATPVQIREFPLRAFLRFCGNHGLLQITDRPKWRTIIGGGREYVKRMVQAITEVRLQARVTSIYRTTNGAWITTSAGQERFDRIVLACQSDQALRILASPSTQEKAVLGAIRYQQHTVVLHSDSSFLPKSRRAWAGWNYHAGIENANNLTATVSYLINKLQPLPFQKPVIVTLNPHREPHPATIYGRYEYSLPTFDESAINAQQQLEIIQGKHDTWFCGAWTRCGFHEDGLMSGIRVASALGATTPWQKTMTV